MKACKQEKFEEYLDAVCAFYQNDFNKELLRAQLQTLQTHFNTMVHLALHTSMFNVKRYFLSLPRTSLSTFSN